jgi:NADH-quinone oxidoreductase subunit E
VRPEEGVPDAASRPPEGSEFPDRVGTEGAMGATPQELPRGWDRSYDREKDPAVIPDLAETDVPDALRAEIEEYMSRYPDRRSASIPALHAAQRVHGWCSPKAIRQVAAVMRVTPGYLSSVASFYDQLNEDPVGRNHVYVCTSVACHLVEAKAVYEAIAAAGADLEDTEIREFECLGACDMAPMASVNGRYVGPLTPEDAPAIVEAIRNGEKPLPGRGLEDEEYRLPWGGRA